MVHKPFLKSSVPFLMVLATRELHSFEQSVYGHVAGYYQTKIILTRTLQANDPISSPGIGSVSSGSPKVDAAEK